jgi:4-amino-4-deoxy-L-arabinose transferase-like glycosyltransferase
VALALRLIPVVLTRHIGIGLDDMFQYDMLARSLAQGNGFRWYAPADLGLIAPYLHLDPAHMQLDPRGMLTTFRAPLYPAFLALIYLINGINDGRFFAARLAQTLLGAALAPLTYFTARRLLPGRPGTAARLAGGVVAAYPMLLIFPFALATENLFFLLVLASFLALLRIMDPRGRPHVPEALLAGFLLGLAALTRSVILPFAGLAVLWIWFVIGQRRLALVVLFALAATIAPWVVRNSLLAGKLTGIETAMGYNLYVGYHPQSTGTFTFGPSLDLMSILDDGQRDQLGTQQAIGFIEQDPGRFPYLALRRLGYFFDLELRAFTYFYVNNFLGYIPAVPMLLTLFVLALPFVVLSLSAAFGWALLPRRPETVLLLLLFIGYLLPHVFILSEERFHLTLLPFFAILAAACWTRGWPALRKRGPWVMAACALIAVLLVVNWGVQLSQNAHTLLGMLGPGGNQIYMPY